MEDVKDYKTFVFIYNSGFTESSKMRGWEAQIQTVRLEGIVQHFSKAALIEN